MNDLMIDIETLGTKPGSVIIEIAAAMFDPRAGKVGPALSLEPDPADCEEWGLQTDPETLEWWELHGGQPGQINPMPLKLALSLLSTFIEQNNPATVWAWGIDFDRTLLADAFSRVGIGIPWHYQRSRDARTVYALAFPDEPLKARKVKHRALHDCKDQIRSLHSAYLKLGL